MIQKKEVIDKIKEYLGLNQDDSKEIFESAIKNYQLRTNHYPTGVLDNSTYYSIIERAKIKANHNVSDEDDIFINDNKQLNIEPEINDSNMNNLDITTDLSENFKDKKIVNYFLPKTQYVINEGKIFPKEYIFLHHTAGWDNPFNTIDFWAGDKLGRVATHFVIGGINIKTNSNKYDGTIVQCIPDNYWAYHLGGTPINGYMHRHSIGIEICNFGALTYKQGKFYTYVNTIVPENQVIELSNSFRGYKYWHKYTDNQIDSVNYLINKLSKQYNIDINNGLKERMLTMNEYAAFDYDPDIVAGKVKGVLSHTSVRKDKLDVSPQPKLVKMINDL